MAWQRVFGVLLGCMAAHTLSAAAQVPEHLLPKTVAASIFGSFNATSFGATIEEWRHQNRGSAFCRAYQPVTLGGDPVDGRPLPPEPWALWCEQMEWSGFREWVFFAVRSSQPSEARLEQSRWLVRGEAAWLAGAHRELAARSNRDSSAKPAGGIHLFGNSWNSIRRGRRALASQPFAPVPASPSRAHRPDCAAWPGAVPRFEERFEVEVAIHLDRVDERSTLNANTDFVGQRRTLGPVQEDLEVLGPPVADVPPLVARLARPAIRTHGWAETVDRGSC